MATVYFMYSKEQINEKNNILDKINKRFVPGTVVINGKREKFSYLSDSTSIMSRFPDMKVVASGEQKDYTYIDPSTESKRGH